MSRTIDRARAPVAGALLVVAVATALPSGAQTIGELADAQRLKQQSEIAKLRREAAEAEILLAAPLKQAEPVKLSAEEIKAAARKRAEASRPKIVLHSLYARNGVWIAELAEGQRLALALVGMNLYGQRIVAIDQRGVHLSKACTVADVREKARCGVRTLNVGEAV